MMLHYLGRACVAVTQFVMSPRGWGRRGAHRYDPYTPWGVTGRYAPTVVAYLRLERRLNDVPLFVLCDALTRLGGA